MRVLVCGGRNYEDAEALARFLDELASSKTVDAVVEGDARGADRIAGEWARRRGTDNVKFCADWANLGRKAGPIRNQQMLDEGTPDLVIAFPGGRGTANMVRRARAAGIEVIEVNHPDGFTSGRDSNRRWMKVGAHVSRTEVVGIGRQGKPALRPDPGLSVGDPIKLSPSLHVLGPGTPLAG